MNDFIIDRNQIPQMRLRDAIKNRSQNDLLFVVGNGLGDRICAEPTLRYAAKNFKDCSISLCCSTPSVFNHIKFKEIFQYSREVDANKFLPLYTYPEGHAREFLDPTFMHGVDTASMTSLKIVLPPECRTIELFPNVPTDKQIVDVGIADDTILIHLGKSWETRTFPSEWWEGIIKECLSFGMTPVLVGKSCIKVDIGPGVIDFREKMSLNDFIWLCRIANGIVTNDSSPVHIAAAGSAKVAFVATCRRPDLLMHTRNKEFGWRYKDFSTRPMWEDLGYRINTLEEQRIDKLRDGMKIENYLPKPRDVMKWVVE